MVFDFVFDNNAIDVIDTVVGTGSLSFDDPGAGTFDFFALTNVSFSADFDAQQFSLSDLLTTTGTTVILSGSSGNRTLLFGGTGNGPQVGSADFLNGSGEILTFEPNVSPGSLAFYGMGSPAAQYFGNYAATEQAAVPLPATLPLALAGIAGLGFVARRRG